MPRSAAVLSTAKSPSRESGAVRRTSRKAPTGLTAAPTAAAWLRKQYLVALVVAVGVSAASLGVGVLDAGVIDVEGIIEERNAKVAEGEVPQGETEESVKTSIPVQESRNLLPNGGLVGAGKPQVTEPSPSEPIASSTASTTDTTEPEAGSTDEAADESAEATTEAAVEESAPEAVTDAPADPDATEPAV